MGRASLMDWAPPRCKALVGSSQAPLRRTGGLLTVASFRTWRGSQIPVAQDPTFNTPDAKRTIRQATAAEGHSAPHIAEFRVTGYRHHPA